MKQQIIKNIKAKIDNINECSNNTNNMNLEKNIKSKSNKNKSYNNKNDHYYFAKQTSKKIYNYYEFGFSNSIIKINTVSGVFSVKKLDKASKLLINSCNFTNESVLDLGCGVGVIGIALKSKFMNIRVDFSDINERAVEITKQNLILNNIKSKVIKSDGFENIKKKYDVILLNPPQSAGKKICQKLIFDCKNHLVLNGQLLFVVRHNKGGKSLSEFALSVYNNLSVISKKSGYRVYGVKNEQKKRKQ